MSSNDDIPRTGEMTDTQLDQLLAAANRELLGYIEAIADPQRTLTAIMAQSTHETPPSPADIPTISHDSDKAPAAVMIGMRIRARDLALFLDRVLAEADVLDLGRVLADVLDDVRALDRARVLDRARARDLALALARVLDRARDLARDLDLARAPVLARDLARELARDLALARVLARVLGHALDAQHVDASGADLSDMKIRHLDTLDGIVWTRQTTWPACIADQVQAHSEQIRPGVYRVRLGNTLDRHIGFARRS